MAGRTFDFHEQFNHYVFGGYQVRQRNDSAVLPIIGDEITGRGNHRSPRLDHNIPSGDAALYWLFQSNHSDRGDLSATQSGGNQMQRFAGHNAFNPLRRFAKNLRTARPLIYTVCA